MTAEDTVQRTPNDEPRRLFSLFAYGSLKRGLRHHEEFCRGALSVEEATVRGRLYELPFGFPTLMVPEGDILAAGTANPTRDAATQRELDEARKRRPDAPPEGWDTVFGELFVFDDPEVRLPALDRLEGFDPDGPSLYRRVLIPVEVSRGGIRAWAYVTEKPSGTYLPGGRWPAFQRSRA